MSFWQFNVASATAGTSSPYSAAFESLAAQTLQGVQSAQFAIVYPRQDAFGWGGEGDQTMVGRPRAELTLSWLFSSGTNESAIGLLAAPSGAAAALAAMNDERNYYLLVNQDGRDAIGYVDQGSQVLALGNAVLTRYDFAAQVGAPTVVTATLEGLNLLVQPSGSGQPLPAIYKQTGAAATGRYVLPTPRQSISSYAEASPASITLSFDTGSAFGVALSGQNACPLQSFGFTVDLPRVDVQDLGWAYPDTRPVQWPARIGLRATATLTQFQLDSLTRGVCPDSGYAFNVGFRNGCGTADDYTFRFDGAKLDSETLDVSVGGGVAKVNLSWSVHIQDVNRTARGNPNWYIVNSGQPYSSIVFPQVDYVSGSAPLTFDLSTPCFLLVLSGPGLLSGNSVFVTDEASTVRVRAIATDGSDTQDLTVTIS